MGTNTGTDKIIDLELLNAFNDCIERIAAGQSVAQCVQLYPQYAKRLQAMLETGAAVRRSGAGAGEIQQVQERVRLRLQGYYARKSRRRSFIPLSRAVGVAALFLAFGLTGSSFAAEQALPGDVLYPLKHITENVRLSVSGNSSALSQQFAARRIDEIKTLLAEGRVEEVYFEGTLDSKQDNYWQIAGLTVTVEPQLPNAQLAQIGDRLGIRAATTIQGELVAGVVTILDHTALPITLTPTSTDTHTPSMTATMTATPTPTQTPTQTATQTATYRPVRIATQAPTSGSSNSGSGSGSSGSDDSGHDGSGSSGSGSSDGGSGGSDDGSGHN